VPIFAVTVSELEPAAALLVGWKVVEEVPSAALLPDDGVKLEAAAPVPEADQTTGSPASTPELGHPEPGVQVMVAVMV
jgi:hypothetical protein